MSTTVKWGLITGMIYAVYYLVTFMTGMQANMMSNMALGVVLMLGITAATFFTIYLGIKEKRDTDWNGTATLGDAFKEGIKIALIGSVIAGLVSALYTHVIDPGYTDRVMENLADQMQSMGIEMTEEQIEDQRNSIMRNPFVGTAATIGWHTFVGVIKSLIAGAILKKDAPPTVPVV